MFAVIRRHPLTAYFVLAFFLSWSFVLLTRISIYFAFLGLFGPMLAAMICAGAEGGRAGLRDLLRRVVAGRAHPVWYALAIGLPFLLTFAAFLIDRQAGGDHPILSPTVLTFVLAIMVVGEEIGWRGYALPRLQARFGPLTSSLVLGVLWATWHLINITIPGLEHYLVGFPVFLLFVVTQSILFTWIANNTRMSVLFAWLFHAAINTSGAMFAIGDPVRQWWFSGLCFGVAALVVILVPRLGWRQATAATASP